MIFRLGSSFRVVVMHAWKFICLLILQNGVPKYSGVSCGYMYIYIYFSYLSHPLSPTPAFTLSLNPYSDPHLLFYQF